MNRKLTRKEIKENNGLKERTGFGGGLLAQLNCFHPQKRFLIAGLVIILLVLYGCSGLEEAKDKYMPVPVACELNAGGKGERG